MRRAVPVLAIFALLLILSGCTLPGSRIGGILPNVTMPLPILAPQNCSDGTLSGQCSQYKPYFCDEGNLAYNATGCGCYPYQVLDGDKCRNGFSCSDGTMHGKCSQDKPSYCYDGNLSMNSSSCGCPEGFVPEADGSCRPKSDCSDGTADLECSQEKSLYCFNGTLVPKASECGCFEGYVKSGNDCTDPYPPDSFATRSWYYRSKTYSLKLGFSSALVDYFAAQPRKYTCHGECPSDWETLYYRGFINNTKEQIILRNITSQFDGADSDAKLMDLMAFAESIPYDFQSALSVSEVQEYPYETLYANLGVCSDKTLLGAAIASKMGYGVALFIYDSENHMALGLKCPMNVSNYGSGYCFLEMTENCSRLTDNTGTYGGVGKLTSVPRVLVIGNGTEVGYETVMRDINERRNFEDAQAKMAELKKLMDSASNTDQYNSYVRQYNSYVKQYNSYIECK